ncbi:PREDICTED: uncharacterized protein LOC104814650 [Tarenaya hassleriana]|uniref:uncharacterized protein LOC104814650 n=1 Tax=Tarenaya hassleriana TaxID=28532 RepID=UPI00053C276A|nr:PREDICTED: uncharacterized protein LOC104814650 [Tarenaya hassleriana]
MLLEKGCASNIVGGSHVKMLVESSLCSSIETSSFNVPRCQSPFTGHYWISHGEACQMFHKLSESYEVSFSDAKPETSGKDLDVSSHPTRPTICPEQSMTNKKSRNALISRVYRRRKPKTSRNALISRVYRRRKPIVKPSGTSTEDNPVKSKGRGDNLNDSLFLEDDRGATKRRDDRLDNCRVYSRRKWKMKSAGIFTEHDSREAKRSCGQLDDSLLYLQKKQRVTTNGTFAENSPGKNKRRGGPDGFVVYRRKKRRVEPTGTSTEHDYGETERSGDQLDDSLLYLQKKQRVTTNGIVVEHSHGKNKRRGDGPDGFLVYRRKKRRVEPCGTSTEHDSEKTKKCKGRVSAVSSLAGRYFHGCNKETDVSNPKNVHKSPVAEVICVSDGMVSSCKNDACSSSKPISGLAFVSKNSWAGEVTGCSSSGAMVTENITKNMSAEEICVSILRRDGLLDGAWPGRTSSHVEETVTIGTSSSSRGCKICDRSVAAENILICDKCEGVFHTYCCSVQMTEISEIDEWLCPSCLKTKRKILNEINNKKRGRASQERKWGTSPPRNEMCSVALMLRDPEQYKTGVRIGTNFQAKVPEWSGPTTSDTSLAGEPLGINQSEYMHHFNINSARKLSSIGNWLQCREEDINGEICGKWRRAPLYEVQTDNWECFCCIFWDPPHADCAVPQELETSEIMKQLKYIETLRPRLDARRRKGRDVHQDNTSSRR